jgi:hypothetical protein
MNPMKRFVLALTITTLACLASAAPAADRRYAIRAESVAAAMSGIGMQVPPGQVTLLTDVLASSNAPRLRVKAMEKSGDHRLMVRLECESSEECQPFYARIHSGMKDDPQAPASLLQAQISSSPGREGRGKTVEMRTGSTATLVLDSQHVHVSLSVVCLENGAVGQKIRVASDDHQRIYLAEVVSDRLLKGSF